MRQTFRPMAWAALGVTSWMTCILGSTNLAQAAHLVRFDFTGTVLAESAVNFVMPGTSFSGWLTFDPTTPDTNPNPNVDLYTSTTPGSGTTIEVAGLTFQFEGLEIEIDRSDSRMTFTSFAPDLEGFAFILLEGENVPGALPTALTATPPNVAFFNNPQFRLAANTPVPGYTFTGRLNTLVAAEPSTQVPEPTAPLSLLLLGLVGAGLKRIQAN